MTWTRTDSHGATELSKKFSIYELPQEERQAEELRIKKYGETLNYTS